MSSAVFLQIQSALILGLMFYGVSKRKQRNLHVKIMSSAIAWDILLILQIELSRSAVAKASKAMVNPMWLNIHVSIAILSVLFYFAMVYTGTRMLKNDQTIRKLHRKLGVTTLILRTLTFLTSFMAVVN